MRTKNEYAMTTHTTTPLALLLALTTCVGASGLLACSSDGGDLSLDGLGDDDSSGGGGTTPAAKTCTALQTSYVGFSGQKLEAGRAEAPIGIDRARMKPFAMLGDDYQRLLGAAPTVLAESGPTFGLAPDRWYVEPQPGAVSIYQAYRVAFEGCLDWTKTDPKWGAPPDATNAPGACADMEAAFWSRTPTPAEIQPCVDVAIRDSITEVAPGGTTTLPTEVRRRWAYACAAVLTAPGFLVY